MAAKSRSLMAQGVEHWECLTVISPKCHLDRVSIDSTADSVTAGLVMDFNHSSKGHQAKEADPEVPATPGRFHWAANDMQNQHSIGT